MIFLTYLFQLALCGGLLAAGTIPWTMPPSGKIKWVVQKTSTLTIAGHTNINRFRCEVNEYTGPDTIRSLKLSSPEDPNGVSLRGVLQINIEDFNCRNKMMTAEFKRILKYRQYPHLRIGFISLEKIPSFNNNAEITKGWVDVELAGIVKRFEIDYTSCRTDAGIMELIGSRAFRFSDFGLRPPRKMAGLVQVADQLDVRFHLYLKQSS